ncbi:MAG: ADP-ribosylglycohydrolase family protein [Actinobacteria bacterium]|nr:ADP-ribosylglycohydrolase family protein [Actinomycetota bacterium]
MDSKQTDRAVGALLGAAAGDALGVPYEYGSRSLRGDEPAQMLGGGLGGIAPGQWSDDTEMACAIAEVAARGADLRTEEALDAIAQQFLDWYATGPPDIGVQTRQVLSRTGAGAGAATRMEVVSEQLHALTGRTAGNGSLMRTSPVALAHLGDRAAIAEAARAVSALTHFDPTAGDACALWCIAIDHAVRTGQLDLRVGLPHVDAGWASLVDEAERREPGFFASNNGWVVTALQTAWSSIVRSSTLEQTLQTAVHAGGDTDTVAAIAGGLAGAAYGGSTVPARWRRVLHGWPGLRSRDLSRLAVLTVRGGRPDPEGWPTVARMPSYVGSRRTTVPHPDDPGVLLGAVGALRPGVADAVVSLCRLGREEAPVTADARDHVEVWIIDKEDANNALTQVLADTAAAVKQLRDEGKTVFLHCVHAHTRTPVAAAAYGALITGDHPREALRRVLAVLPGANPRRSIAAALDELSPAG